MAPSVFSVDGEVAWSSAIISHCRESRDARKAGRVVSALDVPMRSSALIFQSRCYDARHEDRQQSYMRQLARPGGLYGRDRPGGDS